MFSPCIIEGIEVGVSTVKIETKMDTAETFGSGPWEYFSLIGCGNLEIPVVSPELRLVTKVYRNRRDRIEPIAEHFKKYGCDSMLLERALSAKRLDYSPIGKTVEQIMAGL